MALTHLDSTLPTNGCTCNNDGETGEIRREEYITDASPVATELDFLRIQKE